MPEAWPGCVWPLPRLDPEARWSDLVATQAALQAALAEAEAEVLLQRATLDEWTATLAVLRPVMQGSGRRTVSEAVAFLQRAATILADAQRSSSSSSADLDPTHHHHPTTEDAS